MSDVPAPAETNSSEPGYRDLTLLEEYTPYAEAIVARRMQPVETHLLRHAFNTNRLSEQSVVGKLQRPQVAPANNPNGRTDFNSACSVASQRSAVMPSIENSGIPNGISPFNSQTDVSERIDFDSILNSCFSPYNAMSLLPDRSSDNSVGHELGNDSSFNSCSTCVGHCVCPTTFDFDFCVSSRPSDQSTHSSALTDPSIIQNLLERIQALERKQ
jgi:hypothetical protein